MARNKILIERGRLVVTDHGGGVVLKAQTSKKYAGRIDVHLEGFIAHMDYDQAKAEFKKVGVNVESFEQAFSRLKKNGSDVSVFVLSDPRHDAEFIRLDKAARYVRRLIKAGFSPNDINVERDGIELDIVEDLGVTLQKNPKDRPYKIGDLVILPAGHQVGAGKLRKEVIAEVISQYVDDQGSPFYRVEWPDKKKMRSTYISSGECELANLND